MALLADILAQTRAEAVEAIITTVVGPPPPADATTLPSDLSGLRALLRIILGQQQLPTDLDWRMSLHNSAIRLDVVEPVVAALLLRTFTLESFIKQAPPGPEHAVGATKEKGLTELPPPSACARQRRLLSLSGTKLVTILSGWKDLPVPV